MESIKDIKNRDDLRDNESAGNYSKDDPRLEKVRKYILNYVEIISFSDTKVIIKCPNNTLCINGNNLIISKLLKDELLIKGKIINIEFR